MDLKQSPGHVLVVGAGVIGAACAYYLRREGCKVTMVERGQFGAGCSHGNCGILCPSHVFPLARPGVLAEGLRALMRRDSAIYVRPRIDLRLWKWLRRFAGQCNEKSMMEAAHGRKALLDASARLYRELLVTEKIECEFEAKGTLFPFKTQQAFDRHRELAEVLGEKFNVAIRILDGKQLEQYEPALKPGLFGGFWYPNDAHYRPDRFMQAMRGVLEKMGVKIWENAAVQTFIGQDGVARAATTAQGDLSADHFVVATGAWTPMLNSQLGCDIPIQPGKGYSLTMPRPAMCPARPLLFEEHHVVVTPMQSGYRLGSTLEFSGYNAKLNRRRINTIRQVAAVYLHEPYAEPVEEQWFGWRPMTFDGLPVIDRSRRYANVTIAAGHNMLGMSMATGTGKLVAQMVTGQATHISARPYNLQSL